jgi:glycosyltransferase involved in cell wall biosynthesis
MKTIPKADIVIAWNGMPIYAAKSIYALRQELSMDFPVLYTKSQMPIIGLETIISKNIFCIDFGQSHSWSDLGIKVPLIFFHSGWGYKHFNNLAKEVRENGGIVIGLFDNNFRGDFRQFIGSIYFKMLNLNKFNSVIVPGASGRILAKYLGFKDVSIYQSLYYADTKIFYSRKKMSQRKKTFIFVGQLIHRKGIIELVKAFQIFYSTNPDWLLHIIGQGPLKETIEGNRGVIVESFSASEYISSAMNEARFLILPSYRENWGLVVHEATCCGCGLILTSSVGSGVDLASPKNSIVLTKTSVEQLLQAMIVVSKKTSSDLNLIEKNSVSLSKHFSEKKWTQSIKQIIDSFHYNSK